MLRCVWWLNCLTMLMFALPAWAAEPPVDFNRDIRSILSNNCYLCHGPDAAERKGGTDGLRLDTEAGGREDLGGHFAIVPGKPEQSELIRRITSKDPDEVMPPKDHAKQLSPKEIELLTRWVQQGAKYAQHWSYQAPVRPTPPEVKDTTWPAGELDRFVLARLEKEGLKPSPSADRYALIRRVSLDLTGLPPTLEEVEQFVQDKSPQAYEKLVDRLLAEDRYGEHWARIWLDLARYADSAGYADDPPRTIWAYRDYVIRSFNANKPFDQFTIEQIAGDLLPNPTDDQLTATAFHRNTLTNNEGGTNDEEFRTVAIVDRVNTTLAVWMGTTIACAQCHNHKYDPLSQVEFFKLYAILNNTEDADRRDESPLLTIYTPEQRQQQATWQQEIATLEKLLQTSTPELTTAQTAWEQRLTQEPEWKTLTPALAKSQAGAEMKVRPDGSVLATSVGKTDVYTLELPLPAGKITALRLQALPDNSLPGGGPGHAGGNFVLSQLTGTLVPPAGEQVKGRYVRVEIPGKQKILSLAEVQIFRGDENVALAGKASQSSTGFDGRAELAIDNNTNGNYFESKSVTHTNISDTPWWEVDLTSEQALDRIVLWNRTDSGLHTRLSDFRLTILDSARQTIWQQTIATAPMPSSEFSPSGRRGLTFASASADFAQAGFEAQSVLPTVNPDKARQNKGWAISPEFGQAHTLTLFPAAPLEVAEGTKLILTLDQLSTHENHTLGCFQLSVTTSPLAAEFAQLPRDVYTALQTSADKRTDAQTKRLSNYYLSIAPALAESRQKLEKIKKDLADFNPHTTVPICRELPAGKQRTTRLQHRGNYLDLGEEVQPGVPSVFHPLPADLPPNRLALAKWLVDRKNPLTARVIVNRYWEQIFGIGLVRTSEEFGSQGEAPTHAELLDWLAVELMDQKWNIKQFIKLLVTSSAYHQSSVVNAKLLELDPDNRLLARGPRQRLSAEMVRDQALMVSGLLSRKMYGPSVQPPQPTSGLRAAFGSSTDWKNSTGEDRFRRGLYTEWRRSSPYPSMATFDAPNREVCTLRRVPTNTPLQALVTLNDPVYIEAAQSLARRMAQSGDTPTARVQHGFRLCLSRPPTEAEQQRLVRLYETAHEQFTHQPTAALRLATMPLGPLPSDVSAEELAAWTVVGNVLLNLDELLMKR